jgi:hypothetical protein
MTWKATGVVAESDKRSFRLWRTAVAQGEHPPEGAEHWTLAPAVVGATALDCSHPLHEPAYDSEEEVEPGQ